MKSEIIIFTSDFTFFLLKLICYDIISKENAVTVLIFSVWLWMTAKINNFRRLMKWHLQTSI